MYYPFRKKKKDARKNKKKEDSKWNLKEFGELLEEFKF